jgi:hypothetical protein
MTLADIQRAWSKVFDPALSASRPVRRGRSEPTPSGSAPRSFRWRLLAARQLARPAFMTLRAVRDGGRLVDFSWDFACEGASRLLSGSGPDLRGKRLLEVLGEQDGHPALFDQYRRVVEHGAREAILQVHVVNGVNDTYRHGAVRLRDGVAVTLTNLSAVRRAQALQLEFTALHGVTPVR